ncbi:TPA: type III secretion system chaperone PscY [Pseudomonas aeruginosa]|uniref:type III secretion system chaperone PscY n=1 Tax=Pseudomonas aeruginosa TaxID=287 RepID=UPI000EB3600E|nr:type III secretion system chaperone PscY [Pseudomonas aeruginosa]MBH3493595.1 type III secretion system chaperone PscY [Pseudomonas aeruginosa]MBH3506824.1 type III secretion system chaperone PscY [Pseudomonas aeruginosa]MBH3756094.1 type III secretion system chaperone PscY [Pseudomonas aeruginosa]MBH4412771.1 type III secretion system chaperone PscY [Pseudomonas aeruginosa]MBH4467002.1 type III secretion system chaperone PscY [Pseudomonas aeruginosa]
MTLKPTQQRLLLMLGWLHLQCGQPRRAQVLLEALLSVAPERRDGRRALLLALLQQGLGEPAVRLCRQLQEDGKEEPGLWRCLSRAEQLAGRLDAARAAHARALELEARE